MYLLCGIKSKVQNIGRKKKDYGHGKLHVRKKFSIVWHVGHHSYKKGHDRGGILRSYTVALSRRSSFAPFSSC